MSPITSYDDALDFLPKTQESPKRMRLIAKIKLVLAAFGEGLSATRRYHELTARGVAPSEAARRVFSEHYDAR